MPSIPFTSNFPTSLDDIDSLGIASNDAAGLLASPGLAVGAPTFTLSLLSDANEFGATGPITIENEVIYFSRSGISFTVLARGQEGTTEEAHLTGAAVEQNFNSGYHNILNEAIRTMQGVYGFGAGSPTVGKFRVGDTTAGSATWKILSSSDIPASLALSGIPTAPTAINATNDTQIATTEFVHNLTDALSGSGILSLNGSSNAIQTFDKLDDTNVTLDWNTVSNVHTLSAGWTGRLSKSRQDIFTVYADQENVFVGRQFFTTDINDAGLNIGSFSSNPLVLFTGDIWGNSTTKKFNIRENGVDTTLVPIVTVRKTITANNSPLSLFEIALPTLTACGGKLTYFLFCTNATDTQSIQGEMFYTASNKAGVYTVPSPPFRSAETESVPSGQSLSIDFSITTGSDKIICQVTPNTSFLSTSTYYLEYSIQNFGSQVINYL